MDIQHFNTVTDAAGNPLGQYPLTTQSLQALQQQSQLLQHLCSIAGTGNILLSDPKRATSATTIPIILGGKELLTLQGPWRSSYQYINIKTTTTDITADGNTYHNALTKRTAEFSPTPVPPGIEGAESHPLSRFTLLTPITTIMGQMANIPSDREQAIKEAIKGTVKRNTMATPTAWMTAAITDTTMTAVTDGPAIYGHTTYHLTTLNLGTNEQGTRRTIQYAHTPTGHTYWRLKSAPQAAFDAATWQDWQPLHATTQPAIQLRAASSMQHDYKPTTLHHAGSQGNDTQDGLLTEIDGLPPLMVRTSPTLPPGTTVILLRHKRRGKLRGRVKGTEERRLRAPWRRWVHHHHYTIQFTPPKLSNYATHTSGHWQEPVLTLPGNTQQRYNLSAHIMPPPATPPDTPNTNTDTPYTITVTPDTTEKGRKILRVTGHGINLRLRRPDIDPAVITSGTPHTISHITLRYALALATTTAKGTTTAPTAITPFSVTYPIQVTTGGTLYEYSAGKPYITIH